LAVAVAVVVAADRAVVVQAHIALERFLTPKILFTPSLLVLVVVFKATEALLA
jgi:hypothetical protein